MPHSFEIFVNIRSHSKIPTYTRYWSSHLFVCINIIINNDVIIVSLSDYEGVSEVWQLVPSDIFSLITIPFQGKTVKVSVFSDHVILYCWSCDLRMKQCVKFHLHIRKNWKEDKSESVFSTNTSTQYCLLAIYNHSLQHFHCMIRILTCQMETPPLLY